MEKIEIIEVETSYGEKVEHILIDKGNGEFFTQPKELWDKAQAESKLGGTL